MGAKLIKKYVNATLFSYKIDFFYRIILFFLYICRLIDLYFY